MDIDSDSLHKEYDRRYTKYERLKEEIKYILERELESQQIPYHSIEGRVKTFDSFIDKVRRQENDKPFEIIDDICGARIICLFLSDIEIIGRIIESNFAIIKKDDKITTKPEEAFGYLSIHYIAKLPESCSGHRYNDLKGLNFEIQLRTIAMHTWSTISHYLDYKSPNAIPSHLRKDFNALSALFYVADSHFELFFRSSQEAKKSAEEKAQNFIGIEEEEINLDTLTAYLHNKYPDRKNSDPRAVSELVEELIAAGYSNISKLEFDLQRSENTFKQYEKKNPPASNRYTDVGIVRVSLSIINENYINHRRGNIGKKMRAKYEEFRNLIK